MQSTAFRWPVPERSSPQRALENWADVGRRWCRHLATLKNFKGLRSGTKKGNTGFVNDVLEASTNGGLLGVLKNSGSGRYVSNVGQSLGGLKNAWWGSEAAIRLDDLSPRPAVLRDRFFPALQDRTVLTLEVWPVE